MGVTYGKNSNGLRSVCNILRRGVIGSALVFSSCAPLTCTSAGKFGVSDLEKTGDVRAALAICYRAQKDNSAAGGGNTRNCDSLQDEFIRWQRFDVCKEIYSSDKAHCLCQVYKICPKLTDM